MDEKEKSRLEKAYSEMPEEELREMLSVDQNEYEEGVYNLVLEEIQKRDFKAKTNETKSTKKNEKEKIPIGWLNFYVYVRIPLGILIAVISEILSFSLYSKNPVILYVTLISTVFNISILTFLFVGLSRWKLWGWKLNWFVLILEIFLRPLGRTENLTMYLVVLIAGAVFWLLPNAIYFKKRKHLFT